MREFIPSDYIDKEGNVYETVGENIREGKNGAVTSEFPTPKELNGGILTSNGSEYVVSLKNLAIPPQSNEIYAVNVNRNGLFSWVKILNTIINNEESYIPVNARAVANYVRAMGIIPTNFKIYKVAFSYNTNITLNNIDSIPDLEIKVIGDHFAVKSSLSISFIEITSFEPLAPEVVILDTQIYFDETKLSARINTNKPGNYSLLLIAG